MGLILVCTHLHTPTSDVSKESSSKWSYMLFYMWQFSKAHSHMQTYTHIPHCHVLYTWLTRANLDGGVCWLFLINEGWKTGAMNGQIGWLKDGGINQTRWWMVRKIGLTIALSLCLFCLLPVWHLWSGVRCWLQMEPLWWGWTCLLSTIPTTDTRWHGRMECMYNSYPALLAESTSPHRCYY